MSFEERAEKAYTRGDSVRALVILLGGIKRAPPGEVSWKELLYTIYGDKFDSPGMEPDVVKALMHHAECGEILGVLVYRLQERQRQTMAAQLLKVASEKGVEVIAYQPPAQFTPIDDSSDAFSVLPDDLVSEGSSEAAVVSGTRQVDIPDTESLPVPHYVEKSLITPTTSQLNLAKVSSKPTSEQRWYGSAYKYFVAIAATILVLIAGLSLWQSGQKVAVVAKADGVVATFDPFNLDDFEKSLAELTWYPGFDAVVNEYLLFATAIRRFEAGDDIVSDYKHDDERRTPWGMAVDVFVHMRNSEMESAIAAITRMEILYGESLATHYARARLCEYRGDTRCALNVYHSIVDAWDGFIPAWMGLIRLAYGTLDNELLIASVENLRRRVHAHPYTNSLVDISVLDEVVTSNAVQVRKSATRHLENNAEDQFLEAIYHYSDALDHINNSSIELAQKSLEQSLSKVANFAPSLFLAGILAINTYNVDAANQYLTNLIRNASLTADFRWRLQIVVPQAWASVGRPDIGLVYSADVDSELFESIEAGVNLDHARQVFSDDQLSHIEAAKISAIHQLEQSDSAKLALATRIRTLTAAGEFAQATNLINHLETYGQYSEFSKLWRVMGLLKTGSVGEVESVIRRMVDGRYRAIARVNYLYLQGHYEEAVNVGSEWVERGGDDLLYLIRPMVLSWVAMGRGREAQALLDSVEVPLTQQAELNLLKARVLSRFDKLRRDDTEKVYRAMEGDSHLSVQRIVDIASIAFWQRRLDVARKLCERALDLNNNHPEANWLMATIYRMDGRQSQANKHFYRAFRPHNDSASLLLELAYIQYDFENYSQSQELYYRALLKDRNSLEAIRGMAKSYLAYDVRRGQRDMVRIAENYVGNRRDVAQAGEVYKWLAILFGSRHGDRSGLNYLTEAEKYIGERADLLVERGHYFAANNDYDNARGAYIEALQKDATQADAHFAIGKILVNQGNMRSAKNHLERYLLLAPTGEFAESSRALLAGLSE